MLPAQLTAEDDGGGRPHYAEETGVRRGGGVVRATGHLHWGAGGEIEFDGRTELTEIQAKMIAAQTHFPFC